MPIELTEDQCRLVDAEGITMIYDPHTDTHYFMVPSVKYREYRAFQTKRDREWLLRKSSQSPLQNSEKEELKCSN